jgi:hypothetical protein
VEKFNTAGQATGGNMAHALYMPDKQSYRKALKI